MAWWIWVVLGAALLAAELFLIDAEFYLVFLGVAALGVGFAGAAGLDAPAWGQWLAFAALSVVLLAAFRARLYAKLRSGAVGVAEDALAGETGVAREALAPGARGGAELRGTTWTAHNVGSEPIAAGARFRVERSEGLVLLVRRSVD
jgi:membrane protein implicated in regulation of membrane protease activity